MTTASTASRAGFRRLLAIVSAVLLALAFSLQTIPVSAAMTEEQLNAQLTELDAKIVAESDPKKKAKLEAEKATKEQWLNAIK